MDLLLESLTDDKVGENGRRTRAKTFTGPRSRFRGSIKGASFVCRGGSIYVTIRASRIEDLLALATAAWSGPRLSLRIKASRRFDEGVWGR